MIFRTHFFTGVHRVRTCGLAASLSCLVQCLLSYITRVHPFGKVGRLWGALSRAASGAPALGQPDPVALVIFSSFVDGAADKTRN